MVLTSKLEFEVSTLDSGMVVFVITASLKITVTMNSSFELEVLALILSSLVPMSNLLADITFSLVPFTDVENV